MKKIVCVEDEHDIRGLLVDELTDAGYEVEEAANGQLGLDAILRSKPDLVLCDISMPIMDGHLLLQYLRENHPEFADTPFIFLSALADREHIMEGKILGADDYLTKPIDLDLLLVTIKSRLGQIERMHAHKEEQFVKIYKSINGTDKYRSAQQNNAKQAKPKRAELAPRQSDKVELSTEAKFLDLAKRSGGKALVGHMQVVGLEDIKEELGDRWESQFDQIRGLSENTISKHLSETDVFEFWEDIKFLIYFSGLDQQTAAAKARAISREIRQKVLGNEGLSKEVVECCTVDADMQEIEIPPDNLKNADDIVDAVKVKLKQSTENARKREKITLDKIVNDCEIILAPVATTKGEHPTLSVAQFDTKTQENINSLRTSRPGSEELVAEFDILKLAKTSEWLCDSETDQPARVIVNVCFSTLENKHHLQRYEKICRSLSEPVIQQLILNLRRCPLESASWRIMSSLSVLRRYCTKVAVELSQFSLGNIDPHALRTPILTCRYSTFLSWKRQNCGPLGGLVRELQSRNAHLLMYDVPAAQDTSAGLFGEGVNFVACRA